MVAVCTLLRSWVYISMYEHGDVSMAFAIVGTLLFCLFMALLFALPFGLAALLPVVVHCLDTGVSRCGL